MRILPILLLATLAGCGQQLAKDSKTTQGATLAAEDDGKAESDDARPRKKKKPTKAKPAPVQDDGAVVAAPAPSAPAEPPAPAEPALPVSSLAWDGETVTGTPTLNLLPTE